MFTHTHINAPKMFAKFGWKSRTFCHEKWKKRLPNSSKTDYSHDLALMVLSEHLDDRDSKGKMPRDFIS